MQKRSFIILVLALALLFPAYSAQAEDLIPYACGEQGYTTMVDPSWRCEWVDGDGVYYHFDSEYNMPYVLTWFTAGENRVTDGDAFLAEELPRMQENYRRNGGVSISRYGSFAIGSRPVCAADLQYKNSQGLKIFLLIAVDVREDYTAIFRCRYLEETQRQDILDALEILDSNLKPLFDGSEPEVGTNKPEAETGTEVPKEPVGTEGPAPADTLSFSITDVVENENAVGRCAAPAGYRTDYDVFICTLGQSAMNPCLAFITAYRENGPEMYYWSARDYISGVTEEDATQDGQFNYDFQTPMLHYMTATEFCDYLAGYFFDQLGAEDISVLETDTFPQLQDFLAGEAQRHIRESDIGSMGGLLTIDRDVITLCRRSYAFTAGGTDYRCVIFTGNEASYFTLHGYSNVHWVNWGVPFTYVMFCPAQDWAEGSAAFELFIGNTTVSDQFMSANKNMSDALWAGIRKAHDVTDCVSIATTALDRETSAGDDYEDERFTDYIFDQNDYTLSDGSHVKVSTAYDYVYEGDNGMVYYSDSAFSQPGGSTQLYPN